MNTCIAHCFHFFCGSPFSAGNNCARVPHSSSRRRSAPSDEPDDGFLHVCGNVLRCFFFGASANFSYHHNGIRILVCIKQLNSINKPCPDNRVAADSDARRLADTALGKLPHCFVRQCSTARHKPNAPTLMNKTGHNPNFALAGRNNPGTIRTDQARLRPAQRALDANPDGRLYVQDMGAFEEDRIYEPDADVRARMTLVYSRAEELRWNRHDTMALTAMHIGRFTGLPVVEYEALRARPGEHLFVLYHTGWDWTDQAFAADGARVRPVGDAMGGDVAAVRFKRGE